MKKYLRGRCPICKGRLFVNQFGYRCEDCSFIIPQFICNRHISLFEAEKILKGERLILDGFSNKSGQVFTSIPVIKDGEVVLDNTISPCPFSEKGRILVDEKFFRCNLYRTCRAKCCFSKIPGVRRCYNGHLITIEEILSLILFKKISFRYRNVDGIESEKLISINGMQMKVV